MPEEFLTISQLNRYINDVITSGFPQSLWVCGEIQSFDRNRDKTHVFFELVEKDEDSRAVAARMGAVIFANRKAQIFRTLKSSENDFDLKDDIEVKFLCKVNFYEPGGNINLIVEDIDPTYTLGKLAQEKQKLINLLKNKGVLDKNKQVPLPALPLNIGLVTSDDSAAYNDFIAELRKSCFGFKIFLRNTLMQGKNAEKDVCKALDELSTLSGLDVVVITRGGGSLAELSCFDSQKIAEKVAQLNLPVLSGIGHEINITVTDLAAHSYAKTPTAISQFLTELVRGQIDYLDNQLKMILEISQAILGDERGRLKDNAVNLQQSTHQYLKDHNETLIRFAQSLKYAPQNLINNQINILGNHQNKMGSLAKNRIKNDRIKIHSYEKMIEMVHPQNTLKRGFSITRTMKGNLIRTKEDAGAFDTIQTELLNGTIESTVNSVKTTENKIAGRANINID